jgi:hypothetical protein
MVRLMVGLVFLLVHKIQVILVFFKPDNTRVVYFGWQSGLVNYLELVAENGYLGYRNNGKLLITGNVGIGIPFQFSV